MKITNVKKQGNKLKFVIEESSPAFANSLRRIMFTEVPVLSIEDVTFFENSSALYDEVVAHRLGLIPVKTEKGLKLPDECLCKGKGCSRCRVSFTLVKKGPGIVYSGDLKGKNISVADPGIPIVKLFENQSIKLEAIAVLGVGKEHAKWQPGVVSYSYYPDIKIRDAGKSAVDACPRTVLELKGSKAAVKNLENCTLCMACVEASKKGSIEVKGLDNKFIFTVESHGNLKPEQIVLESAKILAKKAKNFEKALK